MEYKDFKSWQRVTLFGDDFFMGLARKFGVRTSFQACIIGFTQKGLDYMNEEYDKFCKEREVPTNWNFCFDPNIKKYCDKELNQDFKLRGEDEIGDNIKAINED